MKNLILILMGAVMLSCCSNHNVEKYKDSKPKLDVKEFFNGHIKAWGIVQDWSGKVVNKFDVTMKGTWEDDEGTLEEDFVFYSGKTQKRIWKLKKISEDYIEGRAGDIIGIATGKNAGDSLNFHYTMDIEVDGKMVRVRLDDWMWAMNDNVIINRSYIKKFGITVAELTIFMKKEDEKPAK
ncbi:MAG: DUF3833 domain-containing protein [Rickettsiales bacterium]|nr:DUF3833 domain-containing protein [Rickettsiales bacterium]